MNSRLKSKSNEVVLVLLFQPPAYIINKEEKKTNSYSLTFTRIDKLQRSLGTTYSIDTFIKTLTDKLNSANRSLGVLKH